MNTKDSYISIAIAELTELIERSYWGELPTNYDLERTIQVLQYALEEK